MKEEDKSSQFITTVSLVKNIIGSGLINFPFIFKTLGIFPACLLTFFIAFLDYITGCFLLQCKDITRKYGFTMYSKLTMGKAGTVIFKLIVIFSGLGTVCFYFKILGELILSVIVIFINPTDSFYFSPVFYTCFCFLIIFPMIYFKSINALDKFSFLGVLSVIIFVIAIIILFVIKFFNGTIASAKDLNLYFPSNDLFTTFACYSSIIDFYCYKFNFFPIYLSLKKRNNKKMKVASFWALMFCSFVYCLLGTLCYFMFDTSIDEDGMIKVFKAQIIDNKNKGKFYFVAIYVTVVCAYILSSILTVPLLFFSVKKNILNLFIYIQSKLTNREEKEDMTEMKNMSETTEKKEEKQGLSGTSSFIIVTITYIATLICALFVDSIISITNALGSTTSNSIEFLFPAFFLIILDLKGRCHFTAWIVVFVGGATVLFYICSEVYKLVYPKK